MKQGLNERAIEKIVKYQTMASEKIAEKLKGERPVIAQPSRDELLLAKGMLGQEDLEALKNEFGPEAVIKFFYKLG